MIKLTASPTKARSAIEALLNSLERFTGRTERIAFVIYRDPEVVLRIRDSMHPPQIGKQFRGFPREINIVIDCGILVTQQSTNLYAYENLPGILNLRKILGKLVVLVQFCKVVLIIFKMDEINFMKQII